MSTSARRIRFYTVYGSIYFLGRIAYTQCKDAAYCYRHSHVAWSVCVCVCWAHG